MEAYIASKHFQGKNEKTFEHDDQLPSLPVPPLNQTLKKYLESVLPHVSMEEYERTANIVREFEQGIGKELHHKLADRAAHMKNWLEDWWLSYAYLQFREPCSPLMNFGGAGPYHIHYWPPMEGTQIERGALALHLMLRFWSLLRKEKLVVDRHAQTKEPWTMDQFRRLFSTSRIPGPQEDKILSYFKTESEGPTPGHVIISCRGRMFKLDAIDPITGEPLTPPQLQLHLQAVRSKCDSEPSGPGVAILTGAERSRWFELRERLKQSLQHEKILEAIQSSIAVFALDDASPMDITALSQDVLLKSSGNLWYDKSINFVCCANGTFGVNCDHAPMDAMTTVTMSYFVDCSLKECGGVWTGPSDVKNSPPAEELVFTLDEYMKSAIAKEGANHRKQCSNIEMKNPVFGDFGKAFIRSHGMHPDAFIQIALQCAYYRLHNKPAPTYETGTTRKYHNGRTETVRSCTVEAVTWARSMLDPSVTNLRRLQLLKQALHKHITLMSEAMNAQGCDRHLLGMWIIAHEAGLPTPALYSDSAYAKSGGGGNFVLSTSFLGYTTSYGGVAPMCRNGYGFFYRISPRRIHFFISTWNSDDETDSMLLYESMRKTLIDMKALLNATAASNM